jgi:hypothetical protein
MNKFIKIPSNEGGSFTQTRNLVNFTIPDNAVYDLSQSYVNFDISVDVVDATPALPAVYNVDFRYLNATTCPYNIALVKNCRLTSRKYGQLADVRRVDILRQNLNQVLLSRKQKEGEEYNSFQRGFNDNGLKVSPWLEARGEGTVLSRYVNHPIRVPFSQLFNIGSSTNYDATKMGETKLHLELNPGKFTLHQTQGDGTRATQWGQTQNTTFADITGPAPTTLTLTTKQPFDTLQDAPSWVGQKISITSAAAGTAAALAEQRVITGIEWVKGGANNKKIVLTLNASLPALPAAADGYTDITCDGVNYANATFSINNAEVVLKALANPMPQDGMSWTHFSTEEYTTAQQQNFRHLFQLEPDSVNVLIMTPANNDDLNSTKQDLSTFQLRLNNDDLTDREVSVYSGLYNDRLNMTLVNMGKRARDLSQVGLNVTQTNAATKFDAGLLLIGNPLPMTANEKLLQVNLNSTAGGTTKLALFKEIPRTVKWS